MSDNLTFRRNERTVGETDRDGEQTRTETVLEYGLVHDGVFVRIGVVTEGQIEDARNRQAAEEARAPKAGKTGTAAKTDAAG